MRIGLVGVGDWGLKLADVFKRAGHEITAHARAGDTKAPDLGELLPWERLVVAVDAVVCAAPPDTSLEVAKVCATFAIPIFVTKPLMLTEPLEPKAPFFVDYVRLWSPMWRELTRTPAAATVVCVDVYGSGPEREFSSLLDYGSHAFAFLHDMLGLSALNVERVDYVNDGPRLRIQIRGTIAKTPVVVLTGNGWDQRKWAVRVCREPGNNSKNDLDSTSFEETRDGDRRIARLKEMELTSAEIEHDPLAAAVDEFCTAVRAGAVTTRWAELAYAVAESLRRIQRAGGLDP